MSDDVRDPRGLDEADARLMAQAVALTMGTDPHPNPRVGAIVVGAHGTILAEGVHRFPGGSHAEAAALAEAGPHARGATLYVTLEPCAHTGRTPPCTSAIIAAGIRRVIVGTIDPDKRVAGKGIAALRAAGIDVTVGIEEASVRSNDPAYFHHRETGLPQVTLKMAMTLDGQAAARDHTAKWITGSAARLDGHRLRATSDVVLVGNGTVISDDPRLDVRLDGYRGKQPRPAIVVGRRPVPTGAILLSRDPIVFTAGRDDDAPPVGERVAVAGPDGVDLVAAMRYLGDHDVLTVMIEGGPSLAGAALRSGIVDRFVLYYGPKLGGGVGIPGFAGVFPTIESAYPVTIERVDLLGQDLRVEGTFAPADS